MLYFLEQNDEDSMQADSPGHEQDLPKISLIENSKVTDLTENEKNTNDPNSHGSTFEDAAADSEEGMFEGYFH